MNFVLLFKVPSSSVYDKSEDAQLEAAIKASLAATALNHPITIANSDSESDCLLSPEPLSDDSSTDCIVNCDSEMMDIDQSTTSTTAENTTNTTSLVNRVPSSDDCYVTTRNLRNRKRPADVLLNEQDGYSARNRLKNPRLEVPAVSLCSTATAPGKSELSDDFENVQIGDVKRSRKRKGGKNKTGGRGGGAEAEGGRASDSNRTSYSSSLPTATTDSICQVLMRFPDGRRSIKSFSSGALIRVSHHYSISYCV